MADLHSKEHRASEFSLITVSNSSCERCLSTGGGGHAWRKGACVAKGGMHSKWGVCGKEGVCMAVGACVAGETVTAADGTHPTGMHSCFFLFSIITLDNFGFVHNGDSSLFRMDEVFCFQFQYLVFTTYLPTGKRLVSTTCLLATKSLPTTKSLVF